jgi:hypothetical protein
VSKLAGLVTVLVLASSAAACGPRSAAPPPVIANTPTGGATSSAVGPLTSARTIVIKDVWVGLGCTHDFGGELTATADGFHGEVELTAGWGQEGGRKANVTVPRDIVAALEKDVLAAQAAMAGAPREPDRGTEWTDDYPSGSMVFTGPAGTYTLAFTDQHRKLELTHDGKTVPLDRAHDLGNGDGPSNVWDTYQAVLVAAQLRQMIDEACGRG